MPDGPTITNRAARRYLLICWGIWPALFLPGIVLSLGPPATMRGPLGGNAGTRILYQLESGETVALDAAIAIRPRFLGKVIIEQQAEIDYVSSGAPPNHTAPAARIIEINARLRSFLPQLPYYAKVSNAEALFDRAAASRTLQATETLWWRYPIAGLYLAEPYLLTVALAGTIISWFLATFILERTSKLKHPCLQCGYDTTGLPVCPECGAAVEGGDRAQRTLAPVTNASTPTAVPVDIWPFDQPRNCASITVLRILKGLDPITLVSHNADDHDWQFLNTHDGTGPDVKDAAVVSLDEIVSRDPSVLEVADLPPGWIAWRRDQQDTWKRMPRPELEEPNSP